MDYESINLMKSHLRENMRKFNGFIHLEDIDFEIIIADLKNVSFDNLNISKLLGIIRAAIHNRYNKTIHYKDISRIVIILEKMNYIIDDSGHLTINRRQINEHNIK